jgi:hypothetical protein
MSRRMIGACSWIYIAAYACLRGFYVLLLMPLAGGTFGSIVGLMIGTYALLLIAIYLLFRGTPMSMALLLTYVIAVSVVWFIYEIPSLPAYAHDRGLDCLLIPAFYGAMWGYSRNKKNNLPA